MNNEKGEVPIQKQAETDRILRLYLFRETQRFTHGVHRFQLADNQMVTAISAQTWSEFIGYLSQITEEDKLVVSPELMTFTGQPLEEVMETRKTIENRVDEVGKKSEEYPQTLFLLGTPTFPEKGKPRNSVAFIQNGTIVGQANKRSGGSAAEYENFDLVTEEPAVLVPETGIGLLICADLSSLSILESPRAEEILRRIGRVNMIGANPANFIHPEAKSLLVISCWGVGGRRRLIKPGKADEYYLVQLRGPVDKVMKTFPQIKEVLNVDRIPLMAEKDLPYTPTHPFNAFYKRKTTQS